MPRTQKKPEPASPTAATNGSLGEVLTLNEAAAYLRLPESDVLQLVKEQGLPARHLGKEWRFLKFAIQDWLRSGSPAKSNKEAWMALAGAWKDDPYLEDMLKEIAKQRGRPTPGDES
jgi:excisionase family DNA binding protein